MAGQMTEGTEVSIGFQDTEEEETEAGEATTREAEDTRLQIVNAGVAGKKIILNLTVPNGVKNARNRTRVTLVRNQAIRWKIARRRNLHVPHKQNQVTLPQFQIPGGHHFMQMCAIREIETNMCTQES